MKVEEVITRSSEETQELGEEFAKRLRAYDIVCLYGDLGAGKTTFVKGVARGLGITSRIISPTFILVRKHSITTISHTPSAIRSLYHVDLYRLENKKDIERIDLRDILEDKDAVIVIEWAEKATTLLPKKRWDISFSYVSEDRRKISTEKI